MSNELKPCPFCGGRAHILQDNDHHGVFFELGCEKEECLGNRVYYTEPIDDTPVAEAISKWNTRASGLDEGFMRRLENLEHLKPTQADLHARAFDVLRTMLEFIDDGRLEYKSEGAFGGPVSNEIHRARQIIQEAGE